MTRKTQVLLLVTVVLSIVTLADCRKEPGGHSVTITWKAAPSTPEATVVGYNLYRRTTPSLPYQKIASNITGTTYEDREVKGGVTYYYAATSVDQRGRESGFSPEITVKVP